MRLWILGLFWSLVFSVACGDPADETIDPSGLTAALEAASAGDVLTLGNTTYAGSYVLPAGVTLRGSGSTVIEGIDGSIALSVLPGSDSEPTVVESLTVQSGTHAIHARGSSGDEVIRLSRVNIETPSGVGLVLSDLRAELDAVSLQGELRSATDEALRSISGRTYSSDERSVLGLAASNATVAMKNVDIRGYVGFGLVAYESSVEWTGGTVEFILGVGVMNESSELSMTDVLIRKGLQSYDPSLVDEITTFGLVSSTDSTTDTVGVQIETIQGIGMLVHQARGGDHLGLVVRESEVIGVHVQESSASTNKSGDAAKITFRGVQFLENNAAGLSLKNAGDVVVEADSESRSFIGLTRYVGTQLVPTDVALGHGLQAEGETTLTLSELDLEDNAITGLLMDGADSQLKAAAGVSIRLRDFACDQDYAGCYGAHSQNGAPDLTSESGITFGDGIDETDSRWQFPTTETQAVGSVVNLVGWIPMTGATTGATLRVSGTSVGSQVK